MERNLHTYHSFLLNLRHIIVVGLLDHEKQFLERKFTYSDFQITVEHLVSRHPPGKKSVYNWSCTYIRKLITVSLQTVL